MKQVVILGSTGSIGVNTLDVLARHRESYAVLALSGWRNDKRLLRQCLVYRPKFAVVDSALRAQRLRDALAHAGRKTTVLHGSKGLLKIASLKKADCIVAAIVGSAGLVATFAAARSGKRLLLANKEALVMSGRLLMETVQKHGTTLLPIDSEHNALMQVLPKPEEDLTSCGVKKLILTASGGPFRIWPYARMRVATPKDACEHPTWVMGKKISVDSATLMNKGLELIEAHWLFGAKVDDIEVLVHPESVVHGLVCYEDGSLLGQLGLSDMRVAIACAFSWPQRMVSGVELLDLSKLSTLHFEKPDLKRFPCLNLAKQALKKGGDLPAALNAANEVAVEAFLKMHIGFCDIAAVVENTLAKIEIETTSCDIISLMAYDEKARALAREETKKR